MKLNQVIVENLLNAINTAAGPGLSMANAGAPDGSSVTEIKRLLRKHKLVTGKDANGNFQTAGPAWTGDNSTEWNETLDDAIKTWKRSINIQMNDDRLLDADFGELRRKDIQFLQAKLFGGGGSTAGLLFKQGSEVEKGGGGPPLAGVTIDINTRINTPSANIKTTVDMLNAVTPTGWYYILYDMASEKGLEGNLRATEIARMWPIVFEKQNQMADVWLETVWKLQIVRGVGSRLKATLANGKKMPYAPNDLGRGSTQNQAQFAFAHFKELANGIIEKYRDAELEARTASENQSDSPILNTQPTLGPTAVAAWIDKMDKALNFDFIAVLPFGRPPDDDVEAVADLMNQLRSAGDWDTVAEAYEKKFNKNLGERLANELDDNEYNEHVVLRLSALRRIMPRILLGSVKFGNNEDVIEVTLDNGKKYKLESTLKAGKVFVTERGRIVKDVLVVDAVLRKAIAETGGNIPDVNVQVTEETRQQAGSRITTLISSEIPEMTAFYTGQKPFDESVVALQLGAARLQDILREVSIQVANGYDATASFEFIRQEVLDDREYLVGDGSEENPGQGIHFDERYRDESKATSGYRSSEDDVEGTEADDDLMNRLQSDDMKDEALREILAAGNPDAVKDFYVRIYKQYMSRDPKGLEYRFADDSDDIMEFLLGRSSNVTPEFQSLIDEIGSPYAAPSALAEQFKEAQTDGWAFFGLGTDDEAMQKLVDQIQDYDMFMSVQLRYQEQGHGRDMLDDIDAEQVGLFSEGGYVEQLKAAIGRSGRDPNLSRMNFGTALQRALGNAQSEATAENLEAIKRNINQNELSDIDAVENLLEVLAELVAEQETVGVDAEQRDLYLEIVKRIGETGKDIDEDWFTDTFEDWQLNNSNNWFS